MEKSRQMAKGGMLVGVGVVIMFLTGVFPTLSYTLAAGAGGCVLIGVIELKRAYGWLIYGALSILSILLVAEKDAVVLFVTLFGYYPILKSKIEELGNVKVEWVLKVLVFNVAFGATYFLLNAVLHIPMELTGMLLLGAALVLNFSFVLYDKLLTIAATQYVLRFKNKP